MLGGGSSLIGGSLKTEILREEALELTLEGFLPFCERGDAPKEEKRSLFRELGLPYVSDPAITRHLERVSRKRRAGARRHSVQRRILHSGDLPQRVADVVEHWYGKRPEIFENRDLDLAVARGAAYYSYVRSTGSGRAGARRPAAHLLHRHRRGRQIRPSAWCRAAPKKARRSNSIATICSWWPTGRSRSGSISSLTRTDDQAGRGGGVRRGRGSASRTRRCMP